jgi:hypothetical protein
MQGSLRQQCAHEKRAQREKEQALGIISDLRHNGFPKRSSDWLALGLAYDGSREGMVNSKSAVTHSRQK